MLYTLFCCFDPELRCMASEVFCYQCRLLAAGPPDILYPVGSKILAYHAATQHRTGSSPWQPAGILGSKMTTVPVPDGSARQAGGTGYGWELVAKYGASPAFWVLLRGRLIRIHLAAGAVRLVAK